MATIKDLLENLHNPNKVELANNETTWSRIRNKDSFDELGLDASALDEFLKEWINNNPYSNI